MFCQQCGIKFASAARFCGQCGTPRDGLEQPELDSKTADYSSAALHEALQSKADVFMDGPSIDEIPTEYLQPVAVWRDGYQDWLEEFQRERMSLYVQFEGFVNAEQGSIWLSTEPIYSCGDCQERVSSHFEQVLCPTCGKTPKNFCGVPIGKGDGTYPVYQVVPGNSQSSFLAILATEAEEDGQGPLPEFLLRVLDLDKKAIAERESLVKMPISGMLLSPEFIFTSLGSISLSPVDKAFGNYHLPGLTQLIATGPRSREHLDCAEVRVGWEAGDFEVLVVTRVSTLEKLKSDKSKGDSFFDRPEILAVLVVKTQEVSRIIPPFKKIRNSFDSRLTDGAEKWIELSRMSRGDIPAAWANWAFRNLMLNEAEAGTLSFFYSMLATEGYLHQIWTWLEMKPPALSAQVTNIDQLGTGFAEVAQWSYEPGGSLTRENLRQWFNQ